MKNIDKKCVACGELLVPSQYARRVREDGTTFSEEDHLVCRNFPFCKLAEKEVDIKVTCERLFQRLVELEDSFKGGAIAPGTAINNMISSRDIDQVQKIEKHLIEMERLDDMPKANLLEIYTNEEIGSKAREVLRRRRVEGDFE